MILVILQIDKMRTDIAVMDLAPVQKYWRIRIPGVTPLKKS